MNFRNFSVAANCIGSDTLSYNNDGSRRLLDSSPSQKLSTGNEHLAENGNHERRSHSCDILQSKNNKYIFPGTIFHDMETRPDLLKCVNKHK